jgi:hypothetical protein
MDIAAMLQANPDQLRALLSTDDIQDIADGANSRAYMLDYFRLMRADGKLPICKAPPPAKATESPQSRMDSEKTWKRAHEAIINHVMGCTACPAPQSRYCEQGAKLYGACIGMPNRAPPVNENLRKLEIREPVTREGTL